MIFTVKIIDSSHENNLTKWSFLQSYLNILEWNEYSLYVCMCAGGEKEMSWVCDLVGPVSVKSCMFYTLFC